MRRFALVGLALTLPPPLLAGDWSGVKPSGDPSKYDLFKPAPQVEVRPSGRNDGSYEVYKDGRREGTARPDAGTSGYRVTPDLSRPTYDQIPGVTAPRK